MKVCIAQPAAVCRAVTGPARSTSPAPLAAPPPPPRGMARAPERGSPRAPRAPGTRVSPTVACSGRLTGTARGDLPARSLAARHLVRVGSGAAALLLPAGRQPRVARALADGPHLDVVDGEAGRGGEAVRKVVRGAGLLRAARVQTVLEPEACRRGSLRCDAVHSSRDLCLSLLPAARPTRTTSARRLISADLG